MNLPDVLQVVALESVRLWCVFFDDSSTSRISNALSKLNTSGRDAIIIVFSLLAVAYLTYVVFVLKYYAKKH